MLLSDSDNEVQECLAQLQADYKAFLAASRQESPGRFLKSLVAGSPFQTAYVRELAFLLCDPTSGHDKAAAVDMAKQAVRLTFSSFGHTKVVEDCFHQVRLKEQKPGVEKRKLSLASQLQVCHSAKVLEAHGWAERQDGVPGPAKKWDDA